MASAVSAAAAPAQAANIRRPAHGGTQISWLIIGGGIHGVHLAARLIGEQCVEAKQVRILDPGENLLTRWRTCTATTGMTHLRSPSVHHLDLNPWSLERFAGKRKKRKKRKPGLFAPPYDRPSLSLFNAHCDRVVAEHGLSSLHVRGRASACRVAGDGVLTETTEGKTLRAENVLLAMGASEQPEWPSWAPVDDPRVSHVFARGFSFSARDDRQRFAVVGGGISAAQVALRLCGEGHHVHLVSRHALREHQFDSDPGWLGPKFMTRFEREACLDRRRAMIVEARHRGSLPPEIRRALRRAIQAGDVSWHEAEVDAVRDGSEGPRLLLSNGDEVCARRILLATGFSSRRPGGALVDELMESAALPCASCGYPIVDSALRWHPRIYVTGPLAELALGPASRNIAGARRAGDRLVGMLRGNGAPPHRQPQPPRRQRPAPPSQCQSPPG